MNDKLKNVEIEDLIESGELDNAVNILYPLFQHYGWKWGDHIPDRFELRNKIVDLAQELVDNDIRSISTGRLHVYWSENATIGVTLELANFFMGVEYLEDEE